MPLHRSGRLTVGEQDIIRRDHKMVAVEDIARKLNRPVKTVQSFIDKNFNKAQRFAEGRSANETATELKASPEWSHAKKEFTKEELVMFENNYVQYITNQFNGNVMPLERTQILSLVKLEILSHRNLKDKLYAIEQIDKLKEKIEDIVANKQGDKLNADERTRIENFERQIAQMEAAKNTSSGDYLKNLDKHSSLMKELKATRDQRIKIVDDKKTSFLDIIRELQEDEIRAAENKQMELVRLAGEKSYIKLGKIHTFQDNEVDRPILNHETVSQDK